MYPEQSTTSAKNLFIRAGIATFLGAFVMYPVGDPLSEMVWGLFSVGAVTLVLWLLLRFTSCLTGAALERRLIVSSVVLGAVISSFFIPGLIGSFQEWPPNEQTVRSEFKEAHPGAAIDSLTMSTNGSVTAFVIKFRMPGDSNPRYEDRTYGETNGVQFSSSSTR